MKPEKIGRYQIKSELGRGGMATVYKAHDPLFEREVAVKVLPREMLHDPQFRVRFEREAKTVASLEHPAIVPVYDVGEEDGQPYFVMRHMTGGSLSERIKENSLSITDTAKIIDRISNALDEAHSKGVVHRDLKPGNILFDHMREPYVSDFGIAKIAQAQGAATVTGGGIIGTPAYMSPEQAQGDKVDGRSDIYALGVIVFEMLTGRQPYEADTPMAVVVKHITDPVPHILDVNPNLPAELEQVIERAMAKNRDERYLTAKEFAQALTAVAHGESPTFTPSKTTRTGQPAEKTQIASAPTTATRIATRPAETQAAALPFWLLGLGGFVVLFIILAVGGFFLLGGGLPSSPFAAATETIAPTQAPTATQAAPLIEEPGATEEIPSPTPEPPTPIASPEPVAKGIGGADLLAFVANNEIWVMNVDGSDLRSLTNDGVPKSDLQWLPDNKTLVYIAGKNIHLVEADTGRVDVLASFSSSSILEAFRISPDAQQVAISFNRKIFIVPYDLDAIRQVRSEQGFVNLQGCVSYTAGTQAAQAAKEYRWSSDSQKIAWLYAGVMDGRSVELIRVVDISSCRVETLRLVNEFPAQFFTPRGYGSNPFIPGYDWDGDFLFLFNTYIRNSGWGDLYEYNMELRKANIINPIGESCCYRDPLWSPDKRYIFFAFQDIEAGFNAHTQFYYIPYASIGTGATFEPIPLPENFYKDLKEPPQPALRPVQP
jgi:tRNA A-37 threonylcarbamoyl transferase component Bud32